MIGCFSLLFTLYFCTKMIISPIFFATLLVSLFFYWLIPIQNIRNVVLSIVSLIYIAYYDEWAALLVIILTIFSYVIAQLIKVKNNKKFYHRIGLIGLIFTLVGFKYLGLFTNTFNNLIEFFGSLPIFNIDKILLPLGISYITFKYISYVTDVYWKRVEQGDFTGFLFYGSFFTIFVAGPIERFKEFNAQVKEQIIFKWTDIEYGIQRIIFGLFKKVVIADWIAYFINPVLKNGGEYSLGIRILVLFGFSIQIYMDFAGYSDIAIGASRLFGIKIMENFDWPYLRVNISEFWKGWHISLSFWIRDYLFFPMSNFSEKKIWMFIGLPLVSMGLCGIWHGASWNFLLWGLWHGVGISILQFWNQYKRQHKKLRVVTKKLWFSTFSTALTFVFVTTGWILFI